MVPTTVFPRFMLVVDGVRSKGGGVGGDGSAGEVEPVELPPPHPPDDKKMLSIGISAACFILFPSLSPTHRRHCGAPPVAICAEGMDSA